MSKQRRRARRDGQAAATGLDRLSWTIRYRRMLKPDQLFDLARHPYLVDIYNCTTREQVLYKAAQMGASEYLVSYAMHAADQRRATVLYVFPTETDVTDFSSGRIGPAIEASPYLSGIVEEGAQSDGLALPTHRRGADRVRLKRVRDRFVYLRGAQVKPDGSAAQLKSVDADVLILDELDEMDSRAPEIARKRLGHSSLAEVLIAGTPTHAGRGVHSEWKDTDQRDWHVRCGACGAWQVMTIHCVVLEWDALGRPVRWNGQADGRAFVACSRCGAELDRLQHGQWVAAFPSRPRAGFHLTKFFSAALSSLLTLVETLTTVDETKRREAFNQDLGEPYTPRGGQLGDNDLDGCVRDYAHGPAEGDRCVMGVDVGRVLYAVIRGAAHHETGEIPQRWAGEVDTFDEVARLARRFNVATIVVDALPETRSARALQAAFPSGVVWLAYYVSQKTGTKRAEPMQWVGEEMVDGERAWNGVVNLDRTRTLDDTLGAFIENKATLPGNAREIRGYYAHMKELVRVVEGDVASYAGEGDDHFCHAENYCRVAMHKPALQRPSVMPTRIGGAAKRQGA